MNSIATLQDLLLNLRDRADKGVTFITSGENDVRVDYPKFIKDALICLGQLQARGIVPKDEALLFINDNRTFLRAFWACILGGVVPVPVSVGGTREHALKLSGIAGSLSSPWLLTDQGQDELAALESVDAPITRSDRYCFLGALPSEGEAGIVYPSVTGDTAFVQFSSGSTGKPKGVVLTHGGICANLNAIAKGISLVADDVALSWMPLTHDMGLIGFHLAALWGGIDHALMPTPLFIRKPLLWMEKAGQLGATVLASPNFGYRFLLRAMAFGRECAWRLGKVRLIINGAESISPSLCAEFVAALAPYGLKPDVILPVYGLAEACLAVTFPRSGTGLRSLRLEPGRCEVGQRVVRAQGAAASEYAILGASVSGCALRIADDADQTLQDETLGNIQIRGANVTQGYLRNPQATAEVITPDGWLRTGDLGFLSGGELVMTGRVTEMVSVFGRKVHLSDVERAAEAYAPMTAGRLAAFGIFDTEAQTESICIAVVFKGAREAFLPIAEAIQKGLRSDLALAPKHVIPLPRLPTTTSGKVQRFQLSEMLARGEIASLPAGPIESSPEPAPGSEGAQLSPMEREIRGICEATLGLPALDIHENLLGLAGESLKLVRLQAALEQRFPGCIKLSDFFSHSSIAQMAAHLGNRPAYAWDYRVITETAAVPEPLRQGGTDDDWLEPAMREALRRLGAPDQASELDVLIGIFAFTVSRFTGQTSLTVHVFENAESELHPYRIDFRSLKGFFSLFRAVSDQRRLARLASVPLARILAETPSRPPGAFAPMVWNHSTPPAAGELASRSGLVLKLLDGEMGLQVRLACDDRILPAETARAWLAGFMGAVHEIASKQSESAEPVAG